MTMQKWLSLGEAYPKGHATPRLKGGSMTPISGDKMIESPRTPHRATQVPEVVHCAKGVKYWISAIRRGDKE